MILVPLIAFWVITLTLLWLSDHLHTRGWLYLISASLGLGIYILIGALVAASHPVTWHILLALLAAALTYFSGTALLGFRDRSS